MIHWELERRKQNENKLWIVFLALKTFFLSSGRREKEKTVLESPGDKESDFKLFCDFCEGKDMTEDTNVWC
jgi:hypothetical protein